MSAFLNLLYKLIEIKLMTWLAGAIFELTAFYLKKWSVPCAKKACPRLKISLVTHKMINIITYVKTAVAAVIYKTKCF